MIDIRSFFSQLLPLHCLLCGAKSGQHPLCTGCLDDLPWHESQQCPVCALPQPQGGPCGQCLQSRPAFDQTFAALDYRFPVDALLHACKYRGQLGIAQLLGQLLAMHLALDSSPDALIPMPLHPTRLRERGFNQAVEIARPVAQRLGIPLELNGVLRIRPTAAQAGLSLRERQRNLRHAFACTRDWTGCHVILIDDVMTTGATLNALAQAFKTAGANRVTCWVVARTPTDSE